MRESIKLIIIILRNSIPPLSLTSYIIYPLICCHISCTNLISFSRRTTQDTGRNGMHRQSRYRKLAHKWNPKIKKETGYTNWREGFFLSSPFLLFSVTLPGENGRI